MLSVPSLTRIAAAALFAVNALVLPGIAGSNPVTLPPVEFAKASLTIVGPSGEKTYTPAELESIGTFQVRTITPWNAVEADYAGVRLADVLAAHGMQDLPAIRVIAENDYAVVVPRETWAQHDALIATRVDGQPHTRRAKGPLQFIFPMSEHPELGVNTQEAFWVWMAKRIEPEG